MAAPAHLAGSAPRWRSWRLRRSTEQRAARRWKNFIRLSWLVFLIALVWLAMMRENTDRAGVDAAYRAGRDQGRDRLGWRGQRRGGHQCGARRVRGRRRQGGGAADQLAGWQPGAGRHHQRRIAPPQGQARQADVRGGRGDLRIGRLLRGGVGRQDLRRQGQRRRQHRRVDGWLRLHRPDGQARRRAPPDDRRREQGLSRPVQPADRAPARIHAGDAQPDPPAVHRRGQGRARRASQGNAGDLQRPVLDRRSRRSSWAWPISWAAWTTWRARWSRPRTSSTTPGARTSPSAWPSASARRSAMARCARCALLPALR